jgi:hypothetical protein
VESGNYWQRFECAYPALGRTGQSRTPFAENDDPSGICKDVINVG